MLQTPTTANKKKSPLGGSRKGRLASPAAAAQPLLPLPSSADKAAVLLREALVSKAKGDNRGYNYVLLQLQGVAGSKYAKIPPVWLHALKRCCTLLKPKHTELFKVLLSFDWSMGEEAVELYSDLVLNLISSNSSHIGPCLEMLVQNLQPRKGKGGAAEVEVSERIFKYIHQAIARVLELAPTSITPLFSALSANFPHRRLDVDTQRFYLSNLLQLTQYCPALRGSVLSIAVKKALELDVEIELALVAEDEEEEEEEFLFDLEINGEARRQEQSEMANKLDVLMGLLFRHLQSLTEGASYEERHELFSFMLQIFDSMIIKTHKSKYTQFLMFYLCWTEEPFAQNFLGYLLNKILDPSNHTLTRQTCAAYVGGFLARASFLSADVMQQTLNVLATWCQNYLDSCTRNIPDAELHALFYSVCQAIFYAVCFKHSAFLLTEDAKQHFASLQLEDIIESSLNPFK
ncbi:DNA independent RNA polymerase I transcription factor, partial [Balamuthia mandrillaris]